MVPIDRSLIEFATDLEKMRMELKKTERCQQLDNGGRGGGPTPYA